jgi:hypothetical protein
MPTLADPPAVSTKRCTTCFQERPIDEFRRRRKNTEDRHTVCRRCYNAEQRERIKAKRRRRVRKFSSDILAANRDRKRVLALTREYAKALGGVERMAGLFKEVFDGARANGRFFTAFRLLNTVLDLAIVVEQLEKERTRQMSDDDLKAVIFGQTMNLVKEHPEVALMAAAKCPGWEVIPPPDEFDEEEGAEDEIEITDP